MVTAVCIDDYAECSQGRTGVGQEGAEWAAFLMMGLHRAACVLASMMIPLSQLVAF